MGKERSGYFGRSGTGSASADARSGNGSVSADAGSRSEKATDPDVLAEMELDLEWKVWERWIGSVPLIHKSGSVFCTHVWI